MLSDAIAGFLPVAIAVALSPIPIVAVVVVLGGHHPRTSGVAFAGGWVVGLAAVSAIVVWLAHGSAQSGSNEATGVSWGLVILGVVLLVLAAKQWGKRPKEGEEPKMPKWMATVDTATPPRAFALGVALSGINPKNLALTAAAAASIAEAGLGSADTAIAVAVFVAIGSVTVAGAVLAFLVAPRPAGRLLQTVQHFMAANNAVIMMVVLLILGAKLIGDGFGGL